MWLKSCPAAEDERKTCFWQEGWAGAVAVQNWFPDKGGVRGRGFARRKCLQCPEAALRDTKASSATCCATFFNLPQHPLVLVSPCFLTCQFLWPKWSFSFCVDGWSWVRSTLGSLFLKVKPAHPLFRAIKLLCAKNNFYLFKEHLPCLWAPLEVFYMYWLT